MVCRLYVISESLSPSSPHFHFHISISLPRGGKKEKKEKQSSSQPPTSCRSVQALGIEATRQRWESHWSNALSDDTELDGLITSTAITTVRLPIGHFTLGPRFCADTPFAGVAGVYVNAWTEVLKLCRRLFGRGVGVLLDLHALPGNANGRDHGGTGDKEPGKFWGNKKSVKLLRAFHFRLNCC